MSAQQCQQAMANGQALVQSLPGNVLILGEMGIGNTSAATLIAARLLELDIAACTGAGTGLDAAGVNAKPPCCKRRWLPTRKQPRRWMYWPRSVALKSPP